MHTHMVPKDRDKFTAILYYSLLSILTEILNDVQPSIPMSGVPDSFITDTLFASVSNNNMNLTIQFITKALLKYAKKASDSASISHTYRRFLHLVIKIMKNFCCLVLVCAKMLIPEHFTSLSLFKTVLEHRVRVCLMSTNSASPVTWAEHSRRLPFCSIRNLSKHVRPLCWVTDT